jgi:hypothetical protein
MEADFSLRHCRSPFRGTVPQENVHPAIQPRTAEKKEHEGLELRRSLSKMTNDQQRATALSARALPSAKSILL